MKGFTTRQTQKSSKLKDNCVEKSTHVVLGGGRFRAYSTKVSRRSI